MDEWPAKASFGVAILTLILSFVILILPCLVRLNLHHRLLWRVKNLNGRMEPNANDLSGATFPMDI